METQDTNQSHDEPVGQYQAEALEDAAEAAEFLESVADEPQFEALEEEAEGPDEDITPDPGIKRRHPIKQTCIFVARNQRDVNTAMAGADWMERGAKHQEVDYSMAALDECQELWTCALNFKWWDRKSFVGDYRNARMELVDLLHFITSEDLVYYYETRSDWSDMEVQPSVVAVGTSMYEAAMRCIEGAKSAPVPVLEMQFKRELKDFINSLSRNTVDWGAFWGMVVSVDEAAWKDPQGAVEHILNLYSAKATLNLFRTKHRNGPNGYRKVWVDGREDNDIMMAWLESQPVYPGNAAVTHWLEEQYARIIAVR